MFEDDEPVPVPRTVRDRRVTIAGAAGIAAGVLIVVALVAPRNPLFNVVGVLGVLASPGPVVGLMLAGAGSSSRLAQRALSAWLTSYVLLLVAFVLAAVLGLVSSSLSIVAAYLALPAALALVIAGPLAGVLLLRERDLPGWRRYAPFGLALSLGLAMLPGIGVPLPSPLLILLLPIMLAIAGAALLTLEREPVGPADTLG